MSRWTDDWETHSPQSGDGQTSQTSWRYESDEASNDVNGRRQPDRSAQLDSSDDYWSERSQPVDFLSPGNTVTVDETDASPGLGQDTEDAEVPALPSSVEQEMDELLARCREAEQSSGPWSQANSLSVSSTTKRPDMVYFVTLLEQRVALAPPSPPTAAQRVPRRKRPKRHGYVLNYHSCRQEARIDEEVLLQMHSGASSPTAQQKEEVAEKATNRALALPHVLEQLRPEVRSWSPLRQSPVKMTPGGTSSTWMGSSEPPGTAGTASSASDALEAETIFNNGLASPKRVRGMSKEAHAASRRTSSKPRQVLVFPMKERNRRRHKSPAPKPKGKVLWLPPLRQVPAPHASVLPLERRNRLPDPVEPPKEAEEAADLKA
ncbi:unnamed protein product [Durusdinium trenchii]|uniref:Uncharacterized protein n=1 Tax=Durusdinium trenchii TaxID=1381693 RepID=A0ABP0NPX8_9DINO